MCIVYESDSIADLERKKCLLIFQENLIILAIVICLKKKLRNKNKTKVGKKESCPAITVIPT